MAEFIGFPIDEDPDDLAQTGFDYVQSQIPGWAPADGNLDTILLEAFARIAAVVATVASSVPTAIFRAFGPLVGVLPLDAAAASAATTWTMRDNAGYTIPAGTQVGIRSAGDTLVAFQTVADVTVTPGNTTTATGEVTIVAVIAGDAGSGLTGTVELIDPLDYVTAVTLEAVTTGGVDAEDDDVYLNRLATQLQLLAPRPIVPADFAALAQNIAGVDRALAIDGYQPGRNETQTITINATGGTYTITFEGQTTTAIAYNANAATVQAALEALSNVAPGDVTVTGGPGGTATLTVAFAGAYTATNVTAMTTNAASLTGGTATATVATLTEGAAASTGNERTVTVAVVDETGHAPSGATQAAVAASLEAQREVNFVVNVIGPTSTEIDVSFTATVFDGYDETTVIGNAEQAVTDYLDPANWGLPPTGDQRVWLDTPTVHYLEIATVINNVQGIDKVTALTIGVHGGSLTAADVALTGPAAMPEPGTITGTAA